MSEERYPALRQKAIQLMEEFAAIPGTSFPAKVTQILRDETNNIVATISKLVVKNAYHGGTSGFAAAVEINRVDLTLEHLVTDPEWCELFDTDTISAANFSLSQV